MCISTLIIFITHASAAVMDNRTKLLHSFVCGNGIFFITFCKNMPYMENKHIETNSLPKLRLF